MTAPNSLTCDLPPAPHPFRRLPRCATRSRVLCLDDPVGYFTRTGAAVSKLVDDQMSDNKNTEKLLPPPLPPMYRLNDRTLVLDWDKTLVYTNWTVRVPRHAIPPV